MKLSLFIALVFVLVAVALGADVRTAESDATGSATGGATGFDGSILEPTERSREIERKRGGSTVKPKPTCNGQYGKSCTRNSECPCTNFCYFEPTSTIGDGKCVEYDRKTHSA